GEACQPGLRQGGSLSPMLLNLYLHHCVDRPWRSQHPGVPLLRYADDILLVCRSLVEARKAYQSLVDVLRSAGMAAKESLRDAVRKLTVDSPAHWMGFHIERHAWELRFGLSEEAWWKLEEKIVLAHEEPNSPIRVFHAIVAWIGQKGPCYPFLNFAAV